MRKPDRVQKIVTSVVGVVVAALVTTFVATGCGDANKADLKNVDGKKPDHIEVYINVDDHPNIARFCIGGVAFASTSRAAGENFLRVPEWDVPFCGAAPK